jgi:hypothetical protein
MLAHVVHSGEKDKDTNTHIKLLRISNNVYVIERAPKHEAIGFVRGGVTPEY